MIQTGKESSMDIEQMIRLVNTVSASNLTEFSYEESGMTVRLAKKQGKTVIYQNAQNTDMPVSAVSPVSVPVSTKASASETEEPATAINEKIITSPLVGVFYAAPAEDADAFVQVGDTVKKGQVLAIVEALKLMNEIESDYDGTITKIFAENGQAVEYGQPLFQLK